jgi:hemolysin activation/secretion protein
LERIVSKLGLWIALSFGLSIGFANVALADDLERFMDALPEDRNSAAAALQYRLENAGFVLAVVDLDESDQLVVNYGKIRRILVSGASPGVKAEISELLLPLVNQQKINLSDLEFHIGLVNDLHGVTSSFALKRLEGNDEYELVVHVDELKNSGLFAVDTIPRDGLSRMRATLHHEIYSLLSGGDVVRLEAAFIQGENSVDDSLSISASYQSFLGDQGAFYSVGIGRSSSRTDVEITSRQDNDYESDSLSFVIGTDLERTLMSSTVLYGETEWVRDRHDQDGDSNLKIIRGSLFQRQDSVDGASSAAGITLSYGWNDHPAIGADNEFAQVQLGLGKVIELPALGKSTELLLDMYGQIGDPDSPDSQLFYLGTSDAQRGFDSGQYAGTSGASASMELAWLSSFAGNTVKPYLFLDAGYVHNSSGIVRTVTRPSSNEILSAGLGFELFIAGTGSSMRSWLAKPLHDGMAPEAGIAAYLQFQTAW